MMHIKTTARNGLFAQKGDAAPATSSTYGKKASALSNAESISPSVTDGEGAGLAGLIRRRHINDSARPKSIVLPSQDNRPAINPEVSNPVVTLVPNAAPEQKVVQKIPVQKSINTPPQVTTGTGRYQLTVRIDLNDYNRFKSIVHNARKTNQEILEEAVLEYLDARSPRNASDETSENIKKPGKISGISDLITRTFS
ncbi:MAG: hypothetical protein OEY85_09505 [Rhodospirillales bacterium]|nr:hypothetical protein [Rhodospirillales bacterium]